MGKIIAVHSYKGGTGKTLMSINLATTLVAHGKKVALLDLDFRAPSLYAALKTNDSEYWLNDYLNNVCEIKRTLIDLTEKYDFKNGGQFLVGLANPHTEAIRDMGAKDRKWEMRALGRLLALKNSLLNDMELDYIIFDTSPGLQYSSINAIVSADIVLVVTTQDTSDTQGTKRMIQELYDLFDKKALLLLNKTLIGTTSFEKEKNEIAKHYESLHTLPVLEVIPCFCDVLRAGGTIMFVKEKPDHPFAKIVEEIAGRIEKI
jgi:septum site-determining protein MinD